MLESGDQDPDYVTFVGVLSACGQVGLVEQGFYYLYELMKKKGVEPGLDHYTCIINMLIKAGRLNEALSFIVSTPSKMGCICLDYLAQWLSCSRKQDARHHIDVDVAMKRNWGGYYLGEEVCVAFAAYNAAVSAPVIIIKCSGKMSVRCHTLMKLASIATARLIMVRDAQFFHHFKKDVAHVQIIGEDQLPCIMHAANRIDSSCRQGHPS